MPSVTVADPKRNIVWTIKARNSTIRCVLCDEVGFAELQVFQNDQLALSERLPDLGSARAHAEELRARLQARGWERVS